MNRVLFSSQSVEWATPQAVYNELEREFHFDFDPCPLGGVKDALSPLVTEWANRRVFCNPPYGDVSAWLKRGQEADLSVFLIPARTDTRWFHDLVLPFADEVRFIRGRLKFGGAKTNAPFPSMLVIYRKVKGAINSKRNSPSLMTEIP
jgi:site-specific DNA-methyltransferase (adenine-specific)